MITFHSYRITFTYTDYENHYDMVLLLIALQYISLIIHYKCFIDWKIISLQWTPSIHLIFRSLSWILWFSTTYWSVISSIQRIWWSMKLRFRLATIKLQLRFFVSWLTRVFIKPSLRSSYFWMFYRLLRSNQHPHS